MTIALAIKVNDGIVLAADSATTMTQSTPNGQTQIINIYNNANKVFNLHKKLPIGLITWGLGNIGPSSISTLVKDFRNQITNSSNKIDIENYDIIDIVNQYLDFIKPKYEQAGYKQGMGFLIGGYSKGKDYPEEWLIEFNDNGECLGPKLLRGEQDAGANWYGQPEPIRRLVLGIPGATELVLKTAGLDDNQIQNVINTSLQYLPAPIIIPSMPIQDAVDIAEFLVETTIKFVKYTPGQQTVGGPIEIATITKHEGYKWIKRKLYFNEKLNEREA